MRIAILTISDAGARGERYGCVDVRGLSGRAYPAGTEVFTSGQGSSVDAFIAGDWLPLRWWEFAEAVG